MEGRRSTTPKRSDCCHRSGRGVVRFNEKKQIVCGLATVVVAATQYALCWSRFLFRSEALTFGVARKATIPAAPADPLGTSLQPAFDVWLKLLVRLRPLLHGQCMLCNPPAMAVSMMKGVIFFLGKVVLVKGLHIECPGMSFCSC